MSKKKKEKRQKDKDIRQSNEEFSSELSRNQNTEKEEKKKDIRDRLKDQC